MRRSLFILFSILFFSKGLKAQEDSAKANFSGRKILVSGAAVALGAGSLFYLNEEWYASYNTGQFHMFNDNGEWLQADKTGHAYTTYQSGRLLMEACDWARFTRNQTLAAGAGGLVYMTAIECMDGFSSGWGFSWGDEIANAAGASLAIGQKWLWNDQKVQLKFSFHNSGLASYNPALLGRQQLSRVLKDYNGQTYWLSMNPLSFGKRKNPVPWLNIAVGYRATGMIGAFSNNMEVKDHEGNPVNIDRERRIYISLDLDLTKIKCRSKLLKGFFSVVSLVKIPAPAIEISSKRTAFHYIYF